MASLRELVQTLLPGATPLVDAREEAMARSVTWVRLLRDRLPALHRKSTRLNSSH